MNQLSTEQIDKVSGRVDILGLQVSRVNIEQTLKLIDRFIERNERRYVVFPNLFCLTQARRDAEYRHLLNSADLTLPDGTPLVWASHWLGQPVGSRVCGPDTFDILNARAAERGYKVYFMGGGPPQNAERVATQLKSIHPTLRVVGTWSPPLGLVEGELNDRILEDIARCQPDILWVGIGAPLQERWIWQNRDRIQARVSLAVGGAFDYYSGKRKRAPRWMCNSGLEWSYRISQDMSLIWKKRYYAYIYEFFLPVMFKAMGFNNSH